MTVPIPESVSWKEAGCIQPLAISIQLARRANMRAHQKIAVLWVKSVYSVTKLNFWVVDADLLVYWS